MNLAYAFVAPDSVAKTGLMVDMLGGPVPAKFIPMGPYDPENARVRS